MFLRADRIEGGRGRSLACGCEGNGEVLNVFGA